VLFEVGVVRRASAPATPHTLGCSMCWREMFDMWRRPEWRVWSMPTNTPYASTRRTVPLTREPTCVCVGMRDGGGGVACVRQVTKCVCGTRDVGMREGGGEGHVLYR
jgi:hypothetical protein